MGSQTVLTAADWKPGDLAYGADVGIGKVGVHSVPVKSVGTKVLVLEQYHPRLGCRERVSFDEPSKTPLAAIAKLEFALRAELHRATARLNSEIELCRLAAAEASGA